MIARILIVLQSFVHVRAGHVALLLVFNVTLATCVSCNRMAASNINQEAQTEHDHFPVHWPETIYVATERLIALDQAKDDSTKSDVSPEKELLDLIRWLPVLAADSDLNEDAFNKIDGWSTKYVPLLEKQLESGRKIGELIATDGLRAAIGELNSVVQLEVERRRSIEKLQNEFR